LEGTDLSYSRLDGALLLGSNLDEAILVRARLDGADLFGAVMDGTDLSNARLDRAVLFGTKFDGSRMTSTGFQNAYMVGTRLFGLPGQPLRISSEVLQSANLRTSAFRNVQISGTNVMHTQNFGTTFGDATVSLPAGQPWPCHWGTREEGPLSDEQYFSRWKGWVEKVDPVISSFEFLFPQNAVTNPVPPPIDCPVPALN
jgi:Pentapeptide repeats (8 copies)